MRSTRQKAFSKDAGEELTSERHAPPPRERGSDRRAARLALGLAAPVLVVALAAFRLHRSPWSASDLEKTPDSVEYALAAHSFATTGAYEIQVDGTPRPPRYPPWFSALVLAPVYLAAPGEIGNGVLGVWICGIASVVAAYGIGRRLAGEGGGVGAALALLSIPAFTELSRQVMTDVPALAFGLGGAWLFLRLRECTGPAAGEAGPGTPGGASASRGGAEWPAMLAAGVLAAGAYAMRSEGILLVLPFALLALSAARSRRSRLALGDALPAVALVVPPAVMGLATVLYNASTFGSALRTGYHYWCSVPYDYPRLVFSADYLSMNAQSFTTRSALLGLGLGAVGAAALWVRKRKSWQGAVVFTLLAALPASAIHLVYFYANVRFHLMLLALLAVLGGAGLGGLLPAAIVRMGWPLWLVLGAAFLAPRAPDPEPMNRIVAEAVARETPADAVVLSGGTPIYLEWFLERGARRRVVPLSRSVEYASKLITPRRIAVLDPPPTGPTDHRAPALLRAGAQPIYPIVASESRETFESWLREGTRVFLDGNILPSDFALKEFLGRTMTLQRVGTYRWLAEVKLRDAGPPAPQEPRSQ